MEKTKVKLLRIDEVAELTGVQPWRLYQQIAAGKGPAHMRIGKTIWIPEHKLVQWIEEQTASSNEGEE